MGAWGPLHAAQQETVLDELHTLLVQGHSLEQVNLMYGWMGWQTSPVSIIYSQPSIAEL